MKSIGVMSLLVIVTVLLHFMAAPVIASGLFQTYRS